MCSCKPHNTYIIRILYALLKFFLKKVDDSIIKFCIVLIINAWKSELKYQLKWFMNYSKKKLKWFISIFFKS